MNKTNTKIQKEETRYVSPHLEVSELIVESTILISSESSNEKYTTKDIVDIWC